MKDANKTDCRSYSCIWEKCSMTITEDGELLRYSCICRRRCYISDCRDDCDDPFHDRWNAHCHNVCQEHCQDCRFCHDERVPPCF